LAEGVRAGERILVDAPARAEEEENP